MADIGTINQQILSKFSLSGILSGVGWLIAVVIFIGGVGGILYYYQNKKVWNKTITKFELTGDRYEPSFRDLAKTVKIGRGGFEVLYWKKARVYRIAFGSKVGKNTFYFFTSPDGYDYNGYLGKNITIDGRIPVVTANPNMRAQYTALEKQIEALHGEKMSFMDKYGSWVFSIAFITIAGFIMYLLVRDIPGVVSSLGAVTDKISLAVDKISNACTLANPNVGQLNGA